MNMNKKNPAAVALGKMTSTAKKKSSAANGKKGGRPRLPSGFGYKKFISVAREYRAGNTGNVHAPCMVATTAGFDVWSEMSIDSSVIRISCLAVLNGHMTCTSVEDHRNAIKIIREEKPEFLKIKD